MGEYVDAAAVTHGFLPDEGAFTTIDVPGAQHTAALSINNRGEIVGEYLDAAGIAHGLLRDASGAFTTLDAPGATQTGIIDIVLARRISCAASSGAPA